MPNCPTNLPISRLLIAGVLFHGLNLLLKNLGFDDIPSLEFIRATVASFLMIYLTTELSVKLRLYNREAINKL